MADEGGNARKKIKYETPNGLREWARAKFVIKVLITISISINLFLGYALPLMSVTKFFIISDEVTFLKTLRLLYTNDFTIFIVLLIFSVFLPILKNVGIIYLMFKKIPRQIIMSAMALVSKWSMADVFIIGLVIAIIKTNSIANAKILSGTYHFLYAVIMMSVIESYYSFKNRKKK